jgi:hypothetical protein
LRAFLSRTAAFSLLLPPTSLVVLRMRPFPFQPISAHLLARTPFLSRFPPLFSIPVVLLPSLFFSLRALFLPSPAPGRPQRGHPRYF